MRRAGIITILAFAATMLASSSAHAIMMNDGDVTKRWGVGANLAFGAPVDDDPSTSLYYGGVVTYGIAENWVVQLDVGYHSVSENAHGLDYGDLQITPVIFSLEWRHPYTIGTSPAAWYFLGGLGPVFLNMRSSDKAPRLGVAATANDALGLRVGAGFDIFFSEHLAWNIEGSYTYTTEDIKLIEPGTSQSEKVNADFLLVGSGVRYYF